MITVLFAAMYAALLVLAIVAVRGPARLPLALAMAMWTIGALMVLVPFEAWAGEPMDAILIFRVATGIPSILGLGCLLWAIIAGFTGSRRQRPRRAV